MKKLLALLLIIAMLTSMLAACVKERSAPSSTTAGNRPSVSKSSNDELSNGNDDENAVNNGINNEKPNSGSVSNNSNTVGTNDIIAFDNKYRLIKSKGETYYSIAKYIGDEKDIVIPEEYDGKPIKVIGSNAFSGVICDSVTIPKTVVIIEPKAFYGHNYTVGYYSCTAKAIIFEEGSELQKIGERAFGGCKELVSIELPDSTVRIENGVFSSCKGLKEIKLPSKVTKVGDGLFEGCDKLEKAELSPNLKKISWGMFRGCTALKEISIPESVTEIGSWAFSDCSSLKSIYFSKNVVKLDEWTLYRCGFETLNIDEENPVYLAKGNCLIDKEKKLLIRGSHTSVIPDDGSVEEIGYLAFMDCDALESVNIPASVRSVRSSAFANCYSLKSITCSEENEVYRVEGNCLIEVETKTLVLGTVSSIIPDDGSVEIIGECAFCGRRIEGIFNIPEGIRIIGKRAFSLCNELTAFVLPSTLTSIESRAVSECEALEKIIYNGIKEDWEQLVALGDIKIDCEIEFKK